MQSDLSNIQGAIAGKDEVIQSILDLIVKETENFDSNLQENQKILLRQEYRIFRLRTLVVAEITQIKRILDDSTTLLPPSLVGAFKKREAALFALNARLTEMREDFNVIQRSAYSNNLRVNI